MATEVITIKENKILQRFVEVHPRWDLEGLKKDIVEDYMGWNLKTPSIKKWCKKRVHYLDTKYFINKGITLTSEHLTLLTKENYNWFARKLRLPHGLCCDADVNNYILPTIVDLKNKQMCKLKIIEYSKKYQVYAYNYSMFGSCIWDLFSYTIYNSLDEALADINLKLSSGK